MVYYNSIMNSLVARLYALLVLLSLAFLIAWGVFDWQNHQKAGVEKSSSLLSAIATELSRLDQSKGYLAPRDVSQILKTQLLPDRRWKFVVLTSANRGVEYYWGPQPPLPFPSTADTAQYVARPNWKVDFLTENLGRSKVFLPSPTEYTLEGLYTFYEGREFFDLLKILGFYLLGLMIATTLLLVVSDNLPRSTISEKRQENETEEFPAAVSTPAFERDQERQEESHLDELNVLDSLEPLENLPILDLEKDEAPKSEEPPQPALEPINTFRPRLELEVERSSRQNHELSLILLSGRKLENAQSFSQIGGKMEAFFSQPELSFEDTERRYAVLLPQKNLEEALREVQEFFRRIDKDGNELFAGVSSLSGRTVSSDVLLKEAEAALNRASRSHKRIVGFKSDNEIYRPNSSTQNHLNP